MTSQTIRVGFCRATLLSRLAVVIWISGTLAAQQLVILIPRAGHNASITGLAFANPSNELGTMRLEYLDEQGLTFCCDPVDPVVIGPQFQTARNVLETFGPAAEGTQGWVLGFSENISLVGFFLSFSPDVSRIDGAEGLTGGQLADVIVFPEVVSGGSSFTELTVLGFGEAGSPLQVNFELVSGDGNVLESNLQTLPPFPDLGSQITMRIADLFDGPIPGEAYVRASGEGISMVGFEEFGDADSSAGRNAIPILDEALDGPSSLFGAQLAQGFGLNSIVTLINPTNRSTVVTMRATSTGTPQVPAQAKGQTQPEAVQRTLPARSLIRESAGDIFSFGGDFVGWIEVTSDDLTGLVGDVTFGSTDGSSLSSVQLQGIPATDVVYSQVSQNDISFTGLTFLNQNIEETDVSIEVYSLDGFMTGEGQLTLAAGEHRPRILPELIPGFSDQSGGFIRVISTLPIYSFELFGFTDSDGGLTSLSAVPPQRINGKVSGQIEVAQEAGVGPPAQVGDIGPVFVAAVDPDTQLTQQSGFTTIDEGYAFSFLLFSGRYEIVAGTDSDGDGLICEPGKPGEFCGFFTSVSSRESVLIQPGEETPSIDFQLFDNSTLLELKGSRRREGLRLSSTVRLEPRGL